MPFLKLSNTLFNHEGEVFNTNLIDTKYPNEGALVDSDQEATTPLYGSESSESTHQHRRRTSSMVGGGVPLNLRPVVSTNSATE